MPMNKLLTLGMVLNFAIMGAIIKDKVKAKTHPQEQVEAPLSLVMPNAPAQPPKLVEPTWTPWPVQGDWDNGLGFYADVLNHSKGRPFASGDRDTRAHETTHGINSEIRNGLLKGKRGNGFYVGKDRAVLIDEPGMKLADLIPFIPEKLRGNRFKLYLEQQQRDWNDMPTYVFDEGVAYLNGSRVSVEEAKDENGGKTDAVHSCAEFTVYCTAFMMAAEKHDKEYFANKQARAFVCWYIREALGVYRAGQKFKQFQWDAKYYDALSTGEDGRPMREFMEKKLGMNLKEVFP